MKIEALYNWFLKSTGMCTDTRQIEDGNLFFALKGDNFNGNKFAQQAVENGALAAVVDEEGFADDNKNIFLVENGLKALQNLATHHRNQLSIPFIGLTGSNGKTTTKELMATCLSPKYNVAFTQGNLNNHIGVPLTLLSVTETHEIAVIEMGANHLNEIADLCEIAQPDYGYITNFGKAHLEGFGGVEGVIQGKTEMYAFLENHGKKVFINADDKIQVERTQGIDKITFAFENNADYKFERNTKKGLAGISFQDDRILSHLSGSYNETNLAAAVTIALHFGVKIHEIEKAVGNYIPNLNRSQEIEKSGYKILKDAYNANPTSMEAALKNFSMLDETKTVILGDMFELGKSAAQEHHNIAELAISFSFEKIYLIGKEFNSVQIQNPHVQQFESRDDFAEFLKQNPISTKRILMKGSRGMALEKLLDLI